MDIKSLNIPQEVKQEIEDFQTEVERLFGGELGEEEFKRFRLQQGIYGQRQDMEQMVRTKLPYGRVTSDQMNCLADFADTYSNRILHVTTRQDIQFHFVKIKEVPKALQDLAVHGMTTREACGNTVRNVTACHKSGTCPDETFDVTPYAKAVSKYLIRHPLTQSLPRKFKISLGGCHGCGLGPIHDIGLNARMKDGKRGFRMIIGGGLGSSPHAAQVYSEFVPVDELLQTCEAVVEVFDKHGDKKNRNKARFKFVVEKYGLEKTRELIQEAFNKFSGKTYPGFDVPEESIPAIPEFQPETGHDSDPDFQQWVARNTSEQRQKGFYNVHIKLLLGDLNSDQARAISRMTKAFAGDLLVMTVHQNIMIPWVKKEAFGNVFGALKEIGLHKAGTEELKDMTSCPGSETCNLGITHSRGLIDHLTEDVENTYTDSSDLDHITIKASGCPNSCGQHHIASIGFSGSAKKVNGVLAPHYEMMLGGRISDEGVVFGETVIKLPAKNIPNAVRRCVDDYKKVRQNGETFVAYYDRMGKKYFGELLKDLNDLPEIESSPQSYIDYHSDTKFTLDDRGQGECAGAIDEMISDHISEAERALFQSKKLMEKENIPETIQQVQRTFLCCARGLLFTEGMDLTDHLHTLEKFESLIVETGIVSESHSGITERYQADANTLNAGQAKAFLDEAEQLVKEAKTAYEKMQSDHTLRIRVDSDAAPSAKEGHTPTRDTFFDVTRTKGKASTTESINLLGIKSPTNYVQAKLKLESMSAGDILEILVDSGESAEKLPRNIQDDGHKLISEGSDNGHHKIIVEKA